MELLDRHADGVIALTGCLQSRFCRRLVEERPADARSHLDDLMRRVRRRERLLRGAGERDPRAGRRRTRASCAIARELGRPLVGTADVHYLRREDYDNHAALLCVQTKSTLEQPKLTLRHQRVLPQERRRDGGVVLRLAGGGADHARDRRALRRRASSWASCCCRRSRRPTARSRARCCGGCSATGCGAATATRSRPRRGSALEFELGVIAEMGFESYFLIVWDFVNYAKENGVAVGPGRGSAAGSIVAYALNITDLDPLANDLLFERFLNPARKSMPDIDIDFSVRGRERVIRYVQEKYGRESVAQIITFGKMAPRAATRDAARVLGYDYATGDRAAKLIPEPIMGRSPSFDDCLKPGQELRKTVDADADVKPHRRRRAGPRGDRPQQLDPRRRRGDRRPAARRDRAAAARRGSRRRRPSTARTASRSASTRS